MLRNVNRNTFESGVDPIERVNIPEQEGQDRRSRINSTPILTPVPPTSDIPGSSQSRHRVDVPFIWADNPSRFYRKGWSDSPGLSGDNLRSQT